MSDRVFISYASLDQAIADRVLAGLEQRGVPCWIADRDVLGGENFQEAIVAALRDARAVVLVFSTHANRSGPIKNELALASRFKRLVVPLRLDDAILTDAFAFELATRQWIDMREDWEGRLDQLARRIGHAGAGSAFPAAPAAPSAAARSIARRPAIAVMPFSSRGTNAAQEPFVDGVTEGIITALSCLRSFPVISRNSVFALREQALNAQEVGARLGARYVLEGSLTRRNCLRANIHLNDAETMRTLLTERFEHELGDTFALEDAIVRTIVDAIEPELLRHERDRARHVPQPDANAYDLYQLGLWNHYQYTRPTNAEAQRLYRAATVRDPDYAQPWAALAVARIHAVTNGWETDVASAYSEALAAARHAVAADPRDPAGHFALGFTYSHTSRLADATAELQETVRLNPSHTAAHANLAFIYNYFGRPADAIPQIELALRLSPTDPRRFIWMTALSAAHYLLGDYRAALAVSRDALEINPGYLALFRYVVASLGRLGRLQEAKAVMPMLRRLDPDLSHSEAVLGRYYTSGPLEQIIEGLRMAGFEGMEAAHAEAS